MKPEFPIRIIQDDGDVVEIATPEELMEQVDTLDTTLEADRIWVRDALDRTVRLVMRGGVVYEFEA